MDTSLTAIQQQLRKLEQLVTSGRMSADDLRSVELGLKTLIDRFDEVQALASNLQHRPVLSGEDTEGLDRLEAALKESVKKDVGD